MIRISLVDAAMFMVVSIYTTASGAERPEGVGVVVDVHWPSSPDHLRYNIGNGDIVTGRYG